jgi:hypothetical protein
MSILTCDGCAVQVDSDFDTDSIVECLLGDKVQVLCAECAEKECVYHAGNGELHADDCTVDDYNASLADIREREVKTIDCTPTWVGLMPLYLEVLAEQGAFCELRVEFMRMAQAADRYNELQAANAAAIAKVME